MDSNVLIMIALFIFLIGMGLVVINLSSNIDNNMKSELGNTLDQDSLLMPSSEAISACTGKFAGDFCDFKNKEETINGTCNDKLGTLVCSLNKTA